MVIRHYTLWDSKKAALMVLSCAFAVSYLTGLAFCILMVKDFYGQ